MDLDLQPLLRSRDEQNDFLFNHEREAKRCGGCRAKPRASQ